MALTRDDYQKALDVQDACNASGLVISLADVMTRICEETRDQGTDAKNSHPILFLHVAQLAHLSGYACAADSLQKYDEAYTACKLKVEELK